MSWFETHNLNKLVEQIRQQTVDLAVKLAGEFVERDTKIQELESRIQKLEDERRNRK